MLYEKNGVITEPRFQKMTSLQWIFHYKEIIHQRKRKEDTIDILMKTILNAGMFSHKDIDLQKVMDIIKLDGKDPSVEAEKMAQEAIDFIEANKEMFPEELTVKVEKKEAKGTPKGKINKDLGIIIPSEK